MPDAEGENEMTGKFIIRLESLFLAVLICFGSLALSGCQQTPEESEGSAVDQYETEATSADNTEASETPATLPSPTEAPSPSPTSAPSPTPAVLTDSEAEAEALKMAEKAGLSREDLRGKYALFQKYYYVVSTNARVEEYRNFLYKFFPLIADHIKTENEEYFLNKVSALGMYTIKTGDFAGGFSGNSIEFSSDNVKYWGEYYQTLVIYHETMHFMDAWIDGEVGEAYLMKDGSFQFYPHSVEDQIDYDQVVYHSAMGYFTEGGAEKYKTEYFTKASTDPTPTGLEFLVGLEYIFGKETVDDIFFSHDTAVKFCNLLRDNGFSDEDIIRMLRTTVTDKVMKDKTKYIDPREVLIRLYIKNIGPDYAKDAKFCRIIASLDKDLINKIPTEYRKFISKVTKEADDECYGMIKKVRKKVGTQDAYFEEKPYTIFLDGELKLVTMLCTYKKEKPVYTSVIFDYDFEKRSVNSIELYKDWVPESIEIEKLPAEEADALVKTLYKDNSEAHNQTVIGKDYSLSNQYKKAEELGNKYGINIWFADLTPDGALYSEDTRSYESGSIYLTLNSIEKVLSLYPEDYFDQLLFENYSAVAICLYTGWFEESFPESVYVNGKNYLIFYVDTDIVSVQGYKGGDTVLKMFPDATPMEAELICDIWRATERVISLRNRYYEKPSLTNSNWTAKNYKGFKYLNSEDDNKLNKFAKKTKMQYFICNEALIDSKNDRILTYEYMMLLALTGKDPGGLSKECLAKIVELENAIRQEFDTAAWPGSTSWESAVSLIDPG